MKSCKSQNPGKDVAVVELFGLVARALVIGIAAGVILGGAVLILSSENIPILTEAAEMHAASLPRF